MGAIAVRVTAKLEGAETVEDLAGYMDNWFDLLAVRAPKLSRLNAFAGVARVIRLAAEKAKWGIPLPKGHFMALRLINPSIPTWLKFVRYQLTAKG